MILPSHLQHPEFRYVLIGKGKKAPHEPMWQIKKNYAFDNRRITLWKENLGIVCGYGSLVVLDIDNPKYINEFDTKTNTFTVKTGSGMRHYYFICDEKFEKNYYVLGDKAGELRVSKSQVVTAGSTHPSGNKYEIYKDIPIQKISKTNLRLLLGNLMNKIKHNISDTSRSGQDWKDVCEMIDAGYNFDDTNRELMLIGSSKWQSAGLDYKLSTYCGALKRIKKIG